MDPEERREMARRGGRASHGHGREDEDDRYEDEDDYDDDYGVSNRSRRGEEDDDRYEDDDYDRRVGAGGTKKMKTMVASPQQQLS
jgi:hypothetical protein